jgi:hypothetical protein
MRVSYSWTVLLATIVTVASTAADAAELRPGTNRAYDLYLEQARKAFLSRVQHERVTIARDAAGVLSAGPAKEDGIISLSGGLVHHWIASAFVRGVTLRQVMEVSSAFASYPMVYKAVIRSELLTQDGDSYRVLMRVKEGEAGISAVLQIDSTVRYAHVSDSSAYAVSDAREIREVKDAGRRDERLLPAGRDSGYLWRANTFTRFIEQQDGVYVETETLALSRQFPPLLGWIIEPIARRVGRRSVETSLREFVAALPSNRQSR